MKPFSTSGTKSGFGHGYRIADGLTERHTVLPRFEYGNDRLGASFGAGRKSHRVGTAFGINPVNPYSSGIANPTR